jgi:hypothetical protein
MKPLYLLTVFCIGCSPKLNPFQQEITKHREIYKEEFLKEERAPLKSMDEVKMLDFFNADVNYKCECDITLAQDKKAFEMPTYSGISKPYYVYAIATCPLKGKTIKLQLYQSINQGFSMDMSNYIFLPFKDITNDGITYGGGRYIDLAVSDIIDNKLTIDFNKCYNPWCAYSDGYNCPIPPKANHLDMAIEAGEKKYRGTIMKKK